MVLPNGNATGTGVSDGWENFTKDLMNSLIPYIEKIILFILIPSIVLLLDSPWVVANH